MYVPGVNAGMIRSRAVSARAPCATNGGCRGKLINAGVAAEKHTVSGFRMMGPRSERVTHHIFMCRIDNHHVPLSCTRTVSIFNLGATIMIARNMCIV